MPPPFNEVKLIQSARDEVVLASLARTTIQTVPIDNIGGRGCILMIDVSLAGTGSITVSIYHRDRILGKRTLLLASAAITTVTTVFLHVFPGAVAAANSIANFQIGRGLEIEFVHNNANTITYSSNISIS